MWAKYGVVFTASALHLKMVFLHLKRICSATESEALSPLKTLHFCSLYLMPHIKTRYPVEESEPWNLRRVSALAESEHRLWLSTTAPSGRPRTAFGIPFAGQKPCTHFMKEVAQLKKKANRKKSIPLTFYVTKENEEIIRQNAKSADMNLTEYLTACAVGKNIVHIDGLNEFTRTLKQQGTNLNQLATLANMGWIQSVNVSDTYELLLDIHKLLKKILERKA